MKIIITGGAGFIGCNAASRHLQSGNHVILIDDLSRTGVARNLEWLKRQGHLSFFKLDLRNARALALLFHEHRDAGLVLHLAGQTAVTTSVANPRADFEANALGTFNVLEAARLAGITAPFIYASTNKVYGGMEDAPVVERDNRYAYAELPHGVPEEQTLDFHSPYGCCYSADTDILTRRGWKKFYELAAADDVLTYNLERKVAEYQRPTAHYAFPYEGKMYAQHNRRLQTCVTPNHKMLVAWDCNHNELENPRLIEAQLIEGKPMAYLLAAAVEEGEECESFVLPEIIPEKHKHHFPARRIPMGDWLRFLGWYISEGHCYEDRKTGNCSVSLTTSYRTAEAIAVMRAIGLSPVVDQHHIKAGSKQLYRYVKQLGKSRDKYIPQSIKELSRKNLNILLKALLDGAGNQQSKNSWKYTTVSGRLADDVQEIAIKCGMASSICLDKEGFYRVYLGTTRTTQCNLGENRSEWIDYAGKVYCVEVPNSVVMVRQNGHAYFSGNSKGAGDQYVRDYHRIYGMKTVVFRQSCIYGYRQFGVEDQGWVAWFMIATQLERPLTIYGDGKQVRDLLFIDDLLDAFDTAAAQIQIAAGRVYNIGGGPANVMSLIDLLAYLERQQQRPVPCKREAWRPGDQKVFVSDIRRARAELGWSPQIGCQQGLERLYHWIADNKGLFQ